MTAPQRKVVRQRLTAMLRRNGYVRRQNPQRVAEGWGAYKKGDEVRFIAQSADGLAKGRREARRLVLSVLRHRFGPVPRIIADGVAAPPDSKLDALGKAIMEFETVNDAQAWLAQGASRRSARRTPVRRKKSLSPR